MSNIEAMKDLLAQWGMIQQVWELKDAGFSLVDAITLVYKAHTRGNAYNAATLLSKANISPSQAARNGHTSAA